MEFPDYDRESELVPVTDRVATSKTKRYLVAAALISGGITLGAVFSPIGLANAQGNDTTNTTVSDAASGGDSSTSGSTATTEGGSSTSGGSDTTAGGSSTTAPGGGATTKPGGPGSGMARHGGRGHGTPRLDAVAGIVGLSVDDLRTQLQSGKSLAEVAKAQGIDEDTLITKLTDALKTRLAEAVSNGRLTQAEADQRLADAPARIKSMVEQTMPKWDGAGPGRGPGGFGPGALGAMGDVRGAINDLAASLGINLDTLRSSMMSGKTLAQAAAEQGVGTDKLKPALVDAATKQIDKAVTDGKLDQAQADKLKSNLSSMIDSLLNGSLPGGGHMDGGGKSGMGGFGRGHGPMGSHNRSSGNATTPGNGSGNGTSPGSSTTTPGSSTTPGSTGSSTDSSGETHQSGYTA